MRGIFGLMAIVGCCGIPLAGMNLFVKKVREKPVKRTAVVLGIMILFLIAGTIGVNVL
ncbi:MAG: hypothetical protein Q4B03_09850 [Lachnospiraceae bacterium]|nr:hypothetical protein [Lachnospiraceae bacterium]